MNKLANRILPGEIESDCYTNDCSTYGTCWDEDGPIKEEPDYDEFKPSLLLKEMKPMFDFFGVKENDINVDDYEYFLFETFENSEPDNYGGCHETIFYILIKENLLRLIISKKLGYGIQDKILVEDFEKMHPEYFLS
jgi:hypothetical protein